MKIHRQLLWLKPYINSIKHLVPLNKIKGINGYSVRAGKTEWQHASITRVKRKYNINILLTENEDGKYIFMNDCLHHLAHEISHLVVWPHDGSHMILEAKIMKRFGEVTKKLKVKNTYRRINAIR